MKHAPLQTPKLLFSVVLYRKPNAEVASEWRVLDICYASRRDQPILPERNTKTPPGVNHTPNGALEEAPSVEQMILTCFCIVHILGKCISRTARLVDESPHCLAADKRRIDRGTPVIYASFPMKSRAPRSRSPRDL